MSNGGRRDGGAGFDGKLTAILEEPCATKAKGSEMMSTYLDEDSEALDGDSLRR